MMMRNVYARLLSFSGTPLDLGQAWRLATVQQLHPRFFQFFFWHFLVATVLVSVIQSRSRAMGSPSAECERAQLRASTVGRRVITVLSSEH
jgi:hypothetical protein